MKHKATFDYSEIAKSALAVSSYLGFLTIPSDQWEIPPRDLPNESLYNWVNYADKIQGIFFAQKERASLPKTLSVLAGNLSIILSYRPEGVSMQLQPPHHTGAALIYHAAKMVTDGTKVLDCEYCHLPFLSGGETRGGGNRRSDARFCGDECRWKHHNEVRSKAKRKKKF